MSEQRLFRKARGMPSGGQFTSHVVHGVSFDSAPTAVHDALGNLIQIEPGYIDNNARYVYQNGQCFALAASVARETGWPMVMRVLVLDDPAVLPFVHHVWVRDPDGVLIDIDGGHDPEVLADDWDEDDTFITVEFDELDATLSKFKPVLASQNMAIARTFVHAAMEQYLDDIESWLPRIEPLTKR